MKIIHRPSGELIAEGKKGWSIFSFEGNYYISSKALKTENFKHSFVPGLCPYKFIYVWMNYKSSEGVIDKFLGWMYVLPNPLFPFIWFRVAVPINHPSIEVVIK